MSQPESLADFSQWHPPSAEELSQQFAGYDVERLLARGGMAAVYVARQRSLDRPVALKLLPPELGRVEGFHEQFANEARVLARLQHPSVVTVIDYGRTDEGSAYIVMELVEGQPLSRWGAAHPFAEKVEAAIQLTEGVAYFHDQGVIHADLKPDNIYVTAKGEIKILDFGLATPFRDVADLQAPRFGTPPYTAPEAYDPQARPDPRSDTYSLGQTLAEFFGSGPFFPTARITLAQHLGRRDLAAVLEPMLRERPEDRPARFEDVVAGLRALTAPAAPRRVAAPLPVRPTSSLGSGRATKKKSGPPWMMMAASLILMVGVAIALRQPWRPVPEAPLPSIPVTVESEPVSPPVIRELPEEIFATDEAETPVQTNAEPAPERPVAESTAPSPPPPAEPAPSEEKEPTPDPQLKELKELQEKFLAALRRGQSHAAKAVIPAWAAEIARFTRERTVPEQDSSELPTEIARLRRIFRNEVGRLKPQASSATVAGFQAGEPEPFSFPAASAANAATPPPPATVSPPATFTLWWQCDDQAQPLLNGQPLPAQMAKAGGNGARDIWQAEVAFRAGDVLGFKLSNSSGPRRHFVAVARAGTRLLFVSDGKWQVLDEEPPEEWWTGKAGGGSQAQRVQSKDFANQEVRDFCAFTRVPFGSLTVCWGRNAEHAYLRRPLSAFDYQTALGVRAR